MPNLQEKLAAIGLGFGFGGFGLTFSELAEIVRVFSGVAAGLASLAAAWYYIRKGK